LCFLVVAVKNTVTKGEGWKSLLAYGSTRRVHNDWEVTSAGSYGRRLRIPIFSCTKQTGQTERKVRFSTL
ncbi:mCG61192, partial [Mus musculus]